MCTGGSSWWGLGRGGSVCLGKGGGNRFVEGNQWN